jgi:hypothetical protein
MPPFTTVRDCPLLRLGPTRRTALEGELEVTDVEMVDAFGARALEADAERRRREKENHCCESDL